MELVQILENILNEKNDIKDLLGENDNIARYPVTIHNALAKKFNTGYSTGYRERYYELTGRTVSVDGPVSDLPYILSSEHYTEYTPQILADIMRDVLNYKLGMKDEFSNYVEASDNFLNYAEYLEYLLNRSEELGYDEGTDKADEDYGGSSDVDIPSINVSNNIITLSSGQSTAIIFYKLETNGIYMRYEAPLTISEEVDLYYYARIGSSVCDEQHYLCEYSDSGASSFTGSASVFQDDDYVYITANEGYNIEYQVDSGNWKTYLGPIMITNNMNKVYIRCFNNYQYGKKISYTVSHEVNEETVYPENVQCYFDYNSDTQALKITLSCNTQDATIWYAISNEDGYFRPYSSPITNTVQNNFSVFTYSELDGVESKRHLLYRWTIYEDDAVSPVQFIQNGSSVYMYTTTEGAKISFRYSSWSDYTNTNSSSLEITPAASTYIYAIAEKDGVYSSETHFKFNSEGYNKKPQKPVISFQQNNTFTITGAGTLKYSTDGTDPTVTGQIYSAPVKIETKTTVGAVSMVDSYVSDTSWGTFTPYNDLDTDAGDAGYASLREYFYVSGSSGFTWTGSSLYISSDKTTWSRVSNGSVSLDATKKTWIKGNIGSMKFTLGEAYIGGNVLSLIVSDGFTDTNEGSCMGLFKDSTGLKDSSELVIPHTNIPEGWLQSMFEGCTNMVNGPKELKMNHIGYQGCKYMFKNCSKLTAAPDFLFTEIEQEGCEEMFSRCVSLITAGKINLTEAGDYACYGMFKDCSNLQDISLTLNMDEAGQGAFQEMFNGCSALVSPEITLNVDRLSMYTFKEMFKGCSKLKSGADITTTEYGQGACMGMYTNCKALTTAGIFAGKTLNDDCCNGMFKNCVSLKQAPELKAVYLTGFKNCYKEMFYGCSSLKYIKALFLDNPGNGKNTANWVYGVSSSGTFEINEQATWYSLRGVNAIPEGWVIKNAATVGDIKSITVFNGMVSIKATNSDDIYYSVTVDSDLDYNNMILYEGEFEIYEDCYVNAICKNDKGVWGTPVSKLMKLDWPLLTVSLSDNYVKIYCPYDYEYPTIQYQLYEFNNTSNLIKDWTVYNGEFKIDKSYTIIVKGQNKMGYWGDFYTYNLVYGINAPVIAFVKGGGNTWVQISYPNTDILTGLYYKVNDLTEGTPPAGWTAYSSTFKIDPYIDEQNPTVVISAIAQVSVDGISYWSSITSLQWDEASSTSLKLPGLIRQSETNMLYVLYDGQTYTSWDKTSVKIAYKFYAGGEKKYFTDGINLRDAGTGDHTNVDVYVRAESGLEWTDWNMQTFEYVMAYNQIELNTPEINIVETENHTYKFYITNNTNVGSDYTINNYFKIEAIAWTAATHPASNSYYPTYTLYGYADGFDLHEELVNAKIYAISTVDGINYTEPVMVEFTNNYAITELVKPTIKLYTSGDTFILKVQNPYTSLDTSWFKMTDTEWGSGTVDEHKYDDWTNVGQNGKLIDEHLGYGKITAYYTYKGLTSPESDVVEYINENVVTKLLPPTMEIKLVDGRYMILFTNDKNEYIRLEWRVKPGTATWGGGVVNEHKYDEWMACYTNYWTLDENLLSGTIQGRTYDGENYSEDIYEFDFVNEVYNRLEKSEIQIIKNTNSYSLKVYNKNLRALNYFRIIDTVWTGFELNSHKYDNWQQAFTTDNQLDTNLISGTIQAYSVYGSENTMDDLAEVEFESEISINATPPTITVTANADGLTYRLKITNNADTSYYPRIKWKMVNTEWTGAEVTTKKYQYTGGGDYWLITQSVNENIDANLISGTIQAFATNESNHLQVYQRTDFTEYNFENQNLIIS